MRGTDTPSAQKLSKSGKESTMREVRGYFRIFARLFGRCYSMTVSSPLLFSLKTFCFSMRDTWAIDLLCYPDKFLHTSIPSDLIQYSIFILSHIEITFLCDQEYLNQGRQNRGGLERINQLLIQSRNSRALNKRNGLSSLFSTSSLQVSGWGWGFCFWCCMPPVIFF